MALATVAKQPAKQEGVGTTFLALTGSEQPGGVSKGNLLLPPRAGFIYGGPILPLWAKLAEATLTR